jgi:hypothetical protein
MMQQTFMLTNHWWGMTLLFSLFTLTVFTGNLRVSQHGVNSLPVSFCASMIVSIQMCPLIVSPSMGFGHQSSELPSGQLTSISVGFCGVRIPSQPTNLF